MRSENLLHSNAADRGQVEPWRESLTLAQRTKFSVLWLLFDGRLTGQVVTHCRHHATTISLHGESLGDYLAVWRMKLLDAIIKGRLSRNTFRF
jgi:hypothetical protein